MDEKIVVVQRAGPRLRDSGEYADERRRDRRE
jgi:hypothetical protein